MSNLRWKPLLLRLALLALATAAPIAFPLAQMGVASLHALAARLILPAAALLALGFFLLRGRGERPLASRLAWGAAVGAVATLALEVIRYPGFRLGFMPGNLPQLMGVLLLDRFALGPSLASNLAGFLYHFWNGACFGIVFALVATGRSWWWGLAFGLTVGIGFLVSPVVQGLGVGVFGKDFGWHFAATVLTAHAAFGGVLGLLARTHILSSGRP